MYSYLTSPVSVPKATQKKKKKKKVVNARSCNISRIFFNLRLKMAETWLQSAARNSVFEVLKRLQHGCLTIATKYTGEKSQSVTFGNGSSESDLGIIVIIKSPQVFVRLCQGFDMVRIQSPYQWQRLTYFDRELQSHTWPKTWNVTILWGYSRYVCLWLLPCQL